MELLVGVFYNNEEEQFVIRWSRVVDSWNKYLGNSILEYRFEERRGWISNIEFRNTGRWIRYVRNDRPTSIVVYCKTTKRCTYSMVQWKRRYLQRNVNRHLCTDRYPYSLLYSLSCLKETFNEKKKIARAYYSQKFKKVGKTFHLKKTNSTTIVQLSYTEKKIDFEKKIEERSRRINRSSWLIFSREGSRLAFHRERTSGFFPRGGMHAWRQTRAPISGEARGGGTCLGANIIVECLAGKLSGRGEPWCTQNRPQLRSPDEIYTNVEGGGWKGFCTGNGRLVFFCSDCELYFKFA